MPSRARMMRGLGYRWTAAAALCLVSMGGGEVSAAPPPPPPTATASDPVIVDFPAHWRSGILTQSTSEYLCPGGRTIRVTASDMPRGGTIARPTTVGSIEIDGAKVNATVLGAVNDQLRSYTRPPQITPECIPHQIRLHIFHLDKGVVSDSRHVDIWSEAKK
jgi:hypothetical protein